MPYYNTNTNPFLQAASSAGNTVWFESDQAQGIIYIGASGGGGGAGTPGGSDTQVQFNDSSAFGGDAGMTYNKTTDVLTVAGGVIVTAETANRIASFDGSKQVKALDTATYPSLTELAYVKGVTSAIQTQIGAKKTTATGNAYKFETTDASGNLQETTVTASRAVVTDANGLPTASATTATEVGYLTGLQADAVDFIELSYLRSLYNLVYR